MSTPASLRSLVAGTLALAIPAAGVAFAQPPTSYVIRDVTVIDVEGGKAAPARSVVIQKDKILSVGDGGAPRPEGAVVIDGRGLYLIPGLFDAHVHYISPDTYGPLMLAHGVTFVREMGNDTATVVALRDRLNSGEVLGPEMVCTGSIVDGKPPVWPFSEACDTPDEARAAVKKLKGAGVNLIKVYSMLKPEVYRAAVEEAHAQGLKAVGHVPQLVDLDGAVEAGQDSNEHLMGFEKLIAKLVPAEPTEEQKKAGIWASMFAWDRLPKADPVALDAALRKLAARPMVQCPTIVVMAGIGSIAGGNPDADGRVKYVPVEVRSFWGGEAYTGGASRMARQNVPHMKTMVGLLHKAGVPLMIGTDLANPYVFAGSSVHDEMRLFAEAGIPAPDILRAATVVPAKFCGVDGRVGTVAPGKTASLVLLSANPLEDISNTTKIAGVFSRGRYYDRSGLDALIKGVGETIAAGKPVETKIVLELPGELVARGTYAMKFGPYDAGTEEFIITRDKDGYSLMAHSMPKGGPTKPFVIKARYTPDAVFRSAEYKELTQSPLVAVYTLEDGTITASATMGGKEQPKQTMKPEAGALMGLPVYCADLLTFRGIPLNPGESRSMPALAFGYPSWRVESSPMKLTREEDGVLKRADGSEAKARQYTAVTTTPIGAFKARTWTDESGLVLKTVVTMPFGTLSAELK